MIKNIVDLFYKLSETHKLIRSFKYGQVTKRQGIGEENHPLVFLEDPIYINDATYTTGQIDCIVNFEILLTPQAFKNWNVEQLSVIDCQNIAHSIALNFVARIKEMWYNEETGIEVKNYNFVTLTNYYDNNASGIRCTMTLLLPNPINYCDTEEHFDDEKTFDVGSLLSDIETDTPDGCVTTWEYKLPKIDF